MTTHGARHRQQPFCRGQALQTRERCQSYGGRLRESGFQVSAGEDLTKCALEEALRAFGKRLQEGKVGVFYFAGHGVQVNAINSLVARWGAD
jgi:chromosome condensin MukBEF MukE localization factor